jgi:hypothetical protein
MKNTFFSLFGLFFSVGIPILLSYPSLCHRHRHLWPSLSGLSETS